MHNVGFCFLFDDSAEPRRDVSMSRSGRTSRVFKNDSTFVARGYLCVSICTRSHTTTKQPTEQIAWNELDDGDCFLLVLTHDDELSV